MKWTLLIIIFAFLINVTLIGVPIEMRLSGLSQTKTGVYYLSSHESVVKLLKKSKLNLYCSDGIKDMCVRPIDYSNVKANIPIKMESCQSINQLPRCDDLVLKLAFNSPDLLKIGLRL